MRKIRTGTLKHQIVTFLEQSLRSNKTTFNSNRAQIKKLAEDQKRLKKEISDLHSIVWEYKNR